jgi:hypothetical protein
MSIPLDRLYHYIESVAQDVYGGNVLIYRFFPHGSKNIDDLNCIKPHTQEENCFFPHAICYDQEPLNYNFYADSPVRVKPTALRDPAKLPKRNLRVKIGNLYDKCLLLHSERFSSEVEKYAKDQFIPVFYWSHAIIARDWFRYARHIEFKKDIKKTFLIYNRAWTGTREYRLKFNDLLIEQNLLDHCQTNFNPYDSKKYYKTHEFINPAWKPNFSIEHYLAPTAAISASSADFDIDDYNNTEFEVVLETLFDDQRQQLTEKILKPIACKQPFVLASGPGVLEYLRSYGFQTFGDIFDESYDLIQDPVDRMHSIIKTMKEITSWTEDFKLSQMEKINKITAFNQAHFFSDCFFNKVITELKNNLITAFDQLESTNRGSQYIDPLIKNIPGMRDYQKKHFEKRKRAINVLRSYRKRNKTRLK